MAELRYPRAVVVTRPTEYDLLRERHGTRDQARFFLATRGQSLEAVEGRHRAREEAVKAVLAAVPLEWRCARIILSDRHLLLVAGSGGGADR